MLVPSYLRFLCVVIASLVQTTLSIMVPTGKIGPITPRKIVPEPIVTPTSFRNPAPVWERIDEGPNPYQPPVYKYTLYEFARKYGRRTLISPPEEEYYKPQRKPTYYWTKTKFYYSPLQFLYINYGDLKEMALCSSQNVEYPGQEA